MPDVKGLKDVMAKLQGGKNKKKKINIYMAKKCPPGVLCIENITFIFLIAIMV